MKKEVYEVVYGRMFGDRECKWFDTREAATAWAEQYRDHLTDREKRGACVFVLGYAAPVAEDYEYTTAAAWVRDLANGDTECADFDVLFCGFLDWAQTFCDDLMN